MAKQVSFDSLLIPTDFSANAWSAFQYARQLITGDDSEIVVMHAIDPSIVAQLVQFGAGDHDDVLTRMKNDALILMQDYSKASDKAINVDTLVCEGEPFLEIICKADEFAVDAIVMSKLGCGHTSSLLFGSTAEKVIRGSKKPVIVLPGESTS